jgi:hypothetical protein
MAAPQGSVLPARRLTTLNYSEAGIIGFTLFAGYSLVVGIGCIIRFA